MWNYVYYVDSCYWEIVIVHLSLYILLPGKYYIYRLYLSGISLQLNALYRNNYSPGHKQQRGRIHLNPHFGIISSGLPRSPSARVTLKRSVTSRPLS